MRLSWLGVARAVSASMALVAVSGCGAAFEEQGEMEDEAAIDESLDLGSAEQAQ